MFRLIILVTCLAFGGGEELENKDSVKLTLFYESYCPYSIQFFVDQLFGSFSFFKKHLKIDLVPFGNAEQSYSDGHFHFTCQHGARECVGNILHACAIHDVCGDKGTLGCPVPKLKKVMDYINCVMQQPDQQAASDKCAKKSGVDSDVVNKCAKSKVGEWLESGYGNQTREYHTPVITYVPFIVINNKHNETMQDDAQTDLKALLCTYMPDVC